MSDGPDPASATDFWRVLFLLLGTARRRAVGRRRRQQELMRRRSKSASVNWNGFAIFGGLVLSLVLHGIAAYTVSGAVAAGQKIGAERAGKIVVDDWFKMRVDALPPAVPFNPPRQLEDHATEALYGRRPNIVGGPKKKVHGSPAAGTRDSPPGKNELEGYYHSEAHELAREGGGTAGDIEAKLRETVRRDGGRQLIARTAAAPGLAALAGEHSPAALLGSVALLWWVVMLVFQGEGLELDLQRRRHPMWEWLFSHPVPAGAVFAAEMLSPIAANPIYWAAPLFAGAVYGMVYDALTGMLAALVVGVPVAVAAACLGKALELGSVIRFSPRSRGALLGLMSWFGYVSTVLLFLGAAYIHQVAEAAGRFLAPLTVVPWPWLGWFVGRQADGSFSFVAGVLACWGAAGVTTTLAIRFCVWGASQGLSGNFERASAGAGSSRRGPRFGKDPLYRKELLWFARDRSAIVQTILIPLTIASFQLFNFRGLLAHARSSWTTLCGAAILFGTYFLWILGSKSLASEGPALWLALT